MGYTGLCTYVCVCVCVLFFFSEVSLVEIIGGLPEIRLSDVCDV